MDRLFLETKLLADDAGAISGIAWKFATPDRVGDVIEKGAFAGVALPLPMLFGHDQNDPVGVWEKAEETAEGLHIAGRFLLDDLPRAREVRALVQAGAVRGLSIGFRGRKALPRKGGGRTITDLELLEVSLVAVPAHPGAKVTSAKSAAGAFPILYGDFKAYRILDRLSLDVLVDPYTRRVNGLTRIHATRRVGGGVLQAARFRKLKMSAA